MTSRSILLTLGAVGGFSFFPDSAPAQAWNGHARDPQHTSLSAVPSRPLTSIAWTAPVDDSPPAQPIYRHYGSPIITAANTVLVPVRESDESFRLEARSATTGTVLWSTASDYSSPPSDGGWVPSFSPTLTPSGRLYYPGAGGTIFRVDNPNGGAVTPAPIYLQPDYLTNQAAYDASVFISTPITSDNAGNIYFGYEVAGSAPGGLTSGIARVAPDGTVTHVSADIAAGGVATGLRVGTNSAPALSLDGSTVYVALQNGSEEYLAAINATTLAPQHRVALSGPMFDGATSSPTVGPDGHVYFGVLGGYHYRGKLLHFTADLAQEFAPGSFGWDITPSIVPASMVPQYTGTSTYLLLTKYNDYWQIGGDGRNKMAILDPNAVQFDPLLGPSGQNVMKEVLTIEGVTPDPAYPAGVWEWCVNTAAVDPFTGSVLVNSEDGTLYRWHLASNSFSESIELQTDGTLEAYTPTAIGPDGTVYAINRAVLFAVVPEPGSALLLGLGLAALGGTMRSRRSARAGG